MRKYLNHLEEKLYWADYEVQKMPSGDHKYEMLKIVHSVRNQIISADIKLSQDKPIDKDLDQIEANLKLIQ